MTRSALLVTRVSVMKLIGYSSRNSLSDWTAISELEFSSVQFCSAAVNTPIGEQRVYLAPFL